MATPVDEGKDLPREMPADDGRGLPPGKATRSTPGDWMYYFQYIYSRLFVYISPDVYRGISLTEEAARIS